MSQRSLSFPCKLLAEDFPTATTAHEYSQVFPPASPFSHIFSWDIWKCLSKYFHTVRGSFFSFVGQFVWNSKGPCEIRSLSIIRWCKFILIWWMICNILPATPRGKSLPNCQKVSKHRGFLIPNFYCPNFVTHMRKEIQNMLIGIQCSANYWIGIKSKLLHIRALQITVLVKVGILSQPLPPFPNVGIPKKDFFNLYYAS